jgi:hypothetical protein
VEEGTLVQDTDSVGTVASKAPDGFPLDGWRRSRQPALILVSVAVASLAPSRAVKCSVTDNVVRGSL